MVSPRLQIGLAFALMLPLACRSESDRYQPVTQHEYTDVEPLDLGVPANVFPSLGAKDLDTTKSVGRFPTGLSIVQVTAQINDAERRSLQIETTAVERTAYWNELLSDLPVLREIRIQRTMALDPRGSKYGELLRKAAVEDCNLCLIYAKSPSEEADAEYVAALWDSLNRQPLAVYRATMTIPHCEREEPKDDEHPRPKRRVWIREADFRAEAELRQMVRDTMWDLAARDQFDATTQPSPWKTDRPLLPRDPRIRILDLDTRKGP